MKIIPVIDLLRGCAVHAERGHRDTYRPLQSPLCRHGEVLPLVRRLYEELHYPLIYLADLDAIQGSGNNVAVLSEIRSAFPDLKLWFDGGFRCPSDLTGFRGQTKVRTVIGSETWGDGGPLPDPKAILSVDLDADGLRDHSGICADSTRRPTDLILMNLTRVGSRNGPDIGLLEQWRLKAPEARLYLAGGVRGPDDLKPTEDAGAAGVLLASALHDGSFNMHIATHLS